MGKFAYLPVIVFLFGLPAFPQIKDQSAAAAYENIYIQYDRDYYVAGKTAWFSTWLLLQPLFIYTVCVNGIFIASAFLYFVKKTGT